MGIKLEFSKEFYFWVLTIKTKKYNKNEQFNG